MQIKTLIVAAVLALGPIPAFAMCSAHQEKTAASCADGYAWNVELGQCVEQVAG